MLFTLKHDFHNFLKKLDKEDEFINKPERSYYVINKLKYKDSYITIAIPLRSNINHSFQKNKDEYIATCPNVHTKFENISGWHITKMIPVKYEYLVSRTKLSKDLKIAEFVGKTYRQLMCDRVKKMLERFEKGEEVFGAVNFDKFYKHIYKPKAKKKHSDK